MKDYDSSTCAARARAQWHGLVIAALVLALIARSTGPFSCVPYARLLELEDNVHSALEKSIRKIKAENMALARENVALRLGGFQRRRKLLPALNASVVAHACGTGSASPVAVQGTVLWQNKHHKFVHRTITISEAGTFCLCKRGTVADIELHLGPGAATVGQSGRFDGDGGAEVYELKLQPIGKRAQLVRLATATQLQDWLKALARVPTDPTGGVAWQSRRQATGASPTDPSSMLPAAPAIISSTRAHAASVDSTTSAAAACHRRAFRFGAHPLRHTAAALTTAGRTSFAAQCTSEAAATATTGASVDEDATTRGASPRFSLPSPATTGGRYLRFDRSFAHGLGHEALVHNLGVRVARALNLTLLFEPLPLHTRVLMHRARLLRLLLETGAYVPKLGRRELLPADAPTVLPLDGALQQRRRLRVEGRVAVRRHRQA